TPLARPSGEAPAEESNGEKKTLWQRLNNITETTLHDFVDITVFLILGALLAATTRLFLTTDAIGELSRDHAVLSILLMMGLAMSGEPDACVAASFVTMRPAAKLAFLVLGPMLDFKLYLMYTRVFRPRLIWTIYTAVVLQVFLYSYATHLFWEKYAPYLIKPVRNVTPTMSEEEAHEFNYRTLSVLLLNASPTPGAPHYFNGPLAGSAIWTVRASREKPPEVSFLQLEMAAYAPESRAFYEGRRVQLIGQFSGSGTEFTLLRYKWNCCAADATKLNARIEVDPTKGQPPNAPKSQPKWLNATGQVRFLPTPAKGGYMTSLFLSPGGGQKLEDMVEIIDPPANPYIE